MPEQAVVEPSKLAEQVPIAPAVEPQAEPEAQEISPEIKRIATLMGWKEGGTYQNVSLGPEEFIVNSHKINKLLKSEVKDLKQTLSQTREHISRVEKAAIERTIREMTQHRDQAIEAGDIGRVRQFDAAIDTEKTRLSQAVVTQPELNAELKEWASENQWFFNDPELKAYALAVQNKLVATGEKLDDATMLARITSRVKEKFPESFPGNGHFSNEKTGDNGKVGGKVEGTVASGGGATQTKPKGPGYSDLGPTEKAICDKFVARGTMTRDEYVEDMKRIGYFDGKR